MQPQVEAEAGNLQSRLGDGNCRELSRLCALLLDENEAGAHPACQT